MKIAYDAKLHQPGCALLQAVYGGDVGIAHCFDTQDWLLAPTPDMKLYVCDGKMLKELVRKTEAARPERRLGKPDEGSVTK